MCDYKGPTIVLIKAKGADAIFGGYNAYDWTGEWGAYTPVRLNGAAQ